MGYGVLVIGGELVRLLVNVRKRRFYTVAAPPVGVASAVSYEDPLQVGLCLRAEAHV